MACIVAHTINASCNVRVKPSNLTLGDSNLICGESAATEKVPSCFSLIVKRTTAISRKRKQCPMSPQRREEDKTCSILQNLRVKQKDSICTFVTINGEFQNCLPDPRRRIHHESQTNKDNLPCEWKAQETWQSTDASGTKHFSVWCCICLIWQNLVIRFTSTSA